MIAKKLFVKLRFQKIGKEIRKKIRNPLERKTLKNENFTILSNTCIGGVIYHDMSLKFLSPTINLYIKPAEFVKFLENIQYYLTLEIKPINSPLKYPVGKLGDITLFFKHYDTIDDAIEKWNERKKRINYDNIFIMMTDRWCCPYEYLKRFNNLKYKNKVCFTHRKYVELECCRQVKKWSNRNCVDIITDVASLTGKRLYQFAKNFNYIKWLNKKYR